MNKTKKVPALLLVAVVGGQVGCHGAAGGQPFALASSSSDEMTGTLTDARCYFNAKAIGGDHQYCAYLSARANLPLLFIAADGKYSLVVNRPEDFAEYVTRKVSVKGSFSQNHELLKLESVHLVATSAARSVSHETL